MNTGNETSEMKYLSSLLSKWMPDESKVAVDSHPRLSGIMDTVNATLAHGPETRLPAAFYDKKGRAIIDRIGVEEWFDGFKESNEYRKVGIGSLAGDIVARMVGSAQNGNDGPPETGGDLVQVGKGRGGEPALKFALSGCHDTTLAALLCSLGAFAREPWPPYTSHIAFELFRDTRKDVKSDGETSMDRRATSSAAGKQSRFDKFLPFQRLNPDASEATKTSVSRKPVIEMTSKEKERLDGLYVRVRYNDSPMVIPGCRLPGKHLEDDESFCTLVSMIPGDGRTRRLMVYRKHSKQ